MRLHRLDVDAFGPFAGHEHVDFDDLAAGGLFLLCGPTGAGKTSVLDAVCFGLFGQVPGERDKAKRLHSDHAPPGSGPRVVLEATVRGRRLRITRSPEWTRPKKRGTGEVKEHAKAQVDERVDGRWQQRTNRVDEAGDFLGSLLGLTLTQFCQVALLPQGRFETFLRCGAQERHALLEKLFGTHRFRSVEEWLVAHRRDLVVRAEQHAGRVAGTVERAAEAGRRPRPDVLEPDTVLAWSRLLREQTWARLAEASQARARADQEAKDARVDLEAARDLAALQARHREAAARDEELRALSVSTQQIADHVERARRAAAVQPFVDIHDHAAGRVRDAETARQGARAAVSGHVGPAGGVDRTDVAEANDVLRRQHAETARLEALLPLQDEIAGIDAELDDLRSRLDGLDRDRDRLQAEARRLAQQGVDARAAHQEATAAAAQAETLRERAARTLRIARAAQSLPAAERRRALLAEEERRAFAVALRTRERWLDLRQARLEQMATELASGLTPGHPCPVCGSAEHPAPAAAGAETVSADMEDAAEGAWRDAEQRRAEHAEALAECDREIAALEVSADGATPRAAQERLTCAEAEVERAETSAAQVDSRAAEVAEIRAAAERVDDNRQTLDTERARLDERHALLTHQRLDGKTRIESILGADPDLPGRLRSTRQATRLWERLLETLREHLDATRVLEGSRESLDDAVRRADFADPDEARAAMLTRSQLSNSETLLRRRHDEAAQVRAVLEDPRVSAAAALPAVDPAPLLDRLGRAEHRRDESVSTEHTLEQRAHRLESLHIDLQAAVADWAPVRESLTVAERLASLCAGTSVDNRHRMRLSAYVLAARLEQVVAAANERLLRMSSGRYALQHSVARGVGDRRGGLGLQVHDGWTGLLRDPATLSGGETFFTSLALALGLADVVTDEAGGSEIATLFVDEGFGSLDPDTLDEVMDVLDQLRSGGRAVGIVSHLGDLRARVPAQVHVHKARDGSTLHTR